MVAQIEISTGMNSFHLFETKWKLKFNIAGRIGIVRKLQVIMKTIFSFRETKTTMPLHTRLLPFLIPFKISSRLYEILHLHLLKFTHAENKLACNNFIPECFARLRNTKRNFHPSGLLHI